MDERLSHLYEKVRVPPQDEIIIINRKKPKSKEGFLPFMPDDDLIPPMPPVGEGYFFHVTGLTHDEKGYPKMDPNVQEKLIRRLCDKIRKHADEIIDIEMHMMDDAKIAIVAFGSVVRSAMRTIKIARKNGAKVGLINLKTIWPFPEKQIYELASNGVEHFVVAEVNYGQVFLEVQRAVRGEAEVHGVFKMGGALPSPLEIWSTINKVM